MIVLMIAFFVGIIIFSLMRIKQIENAQKYRGYSGYSSSPTPNSQQTNQILTDAAVICASTVIAGGNH